MTVYHLTRGTPQSPHVQRVEADRIDRRGDQIIFFAIGAEGDAEPHETQSIALGEINGMTTGYHAGDDVLIIPTAEQHTNDRGVITSISERRIVVEFKEGRCSSFPPGDVGVVHFGFRGIFQN